MQRYEHKSTEPIGDKDPFAPQLEGWELVAVVPTYAKGTVHGNAYQSTLDLKGRVMYWKRPVELAHVPDWKKRVLAWLGAGAMDRMPIEDRRALQDIIEES